MQHFFCDYNWIERKISAYAARLQTLGVTDIVGVSRGGIFPATIAAFELGIKNIHLLNYCRDNKLVTAQFYRPINETSVVLLCEDVAGDGNTLVDCIKYLEQFNCKIYVLTIAHFNGSKIIPDFSFDFGEIISVFPWERFSVNHQAKNEWRLNRKLSKADADYYQYGSDLDGVFLPDVEDRIYHENLALALDMRKKLTPYESEHFPPIDLSKAHIVTGRPICDYDVTVEWLNKHNIAFEALHMRDTNEIDFTAADDHYVKSEKSALSKVQHIYRLGLTHYYESDPLQATLIAKMLPFIKVIWWNNKLNVRQLVSLEELVYSTLTL